MCNQLNEDTKFKNTAKRQHWRCSSSLFGAGGGEGAADYTSQPEPSVRTSPWHGRQVASAALRCAAAAIRHAAFNDCNNSPQPGDESGDRTQSVEAIRNGGEEADFLKSLASCRRRRSLGGGGGPLYTPYQFDFNSTVRVHLTVRVGD